MFFFLTATNDRDPEIMFKADLQFDKFNQSVQLVFQNLIYIQMFFFVYYQLYTWANHNDTISQVSTLLSLHSLTKIFMYESTNQSHTPFNLQSFLMIIHVLSWPAPEKNNKYDKRERKTRITFLMDAFN